MTHAAHGVEDEVEAGLGGGGGGGHVHRHIRYQAVSMVTALACPECGVFVGSGFLGAHNAFHDLLDEIARRGVVVLDGEVAGDHDIITTGAGGLGG